MERRGSGAGLERGRRKTVEEQERNRRKNECTAEPTLLCTLESKGWKLEVAQISGNAHTFIIRYYLMSKVATKEELEAGITGVTEK